MFAHAGTLVFITSDRVIFKPTRREIHQALRLDNQDLMAANPGWLLHPLKIHSLTKSGRLGHSDSCYRRRISSNFWVEMGLYREQKLKFFLWLVQGIRKIRFEARLKNCKPGGLIRVFPVKKRQAI